ncbi:MAG: MarR family transcriptional regulator [Saprospiraceae bacterium]|nr:MarR family transcriptional regulator [Saprospiraceae bacterium]
MIRLVERHTSTNIGKMLEQMGYAPLTARHLQVFENIDLLEGSSIVQLAQRAAVSKQAMSKLVQESTAAGCLDVMPNPSDSRFVIAKLTPKGVQLRQDVLDKVIVFYNNLTDSDTNHEADSEIISQTISETEIESMTDTLLKMLKYFERASASKAA